MIRYIIRRCLYAVPTLIGVNLIVFALFFFVNTPDDMARAHLGSKRVSPEQIDAWKRERSLDLPYFYNNGWRRIGALVAAEQKNQSVFGSAGGGNYALIVESPSTASELQPRMLRIACSEPARLSLPAGFDAEGRITLPAESIMRRFVFSIAPAAAGAPEFATTLTLSLDVASAAPTHRVLLEYQSSMTTAARLTQTVFFQRSVKMLFFSFGKSDDGKKISDEIFKRILPSLSIAVPVLFLAISINIFLAMMLAFYRGTHIDYWGVGLSVLFMSISALFYIMGGQYFFSKMLRLAPISGYDYGAHSLKFIALPILIIVISELGGSIRFYRTVFLEEINRDYVRTARAKGLPESVVLFIHVLKNAMLPILTGVVAGLPFLIAGNLLLESFFAIPGMGSFTLDAIQRQDFAVVQAMVCLGSFMYIVGLMLTDISYTLVDPRVRLE